MEALASWIRSRVQHPLDDAGAYEENSTGAGDSQQRFYQGHGRVAGCG